MTAVLKLAGSAISEQHRNDEATITNGLQTFYEVGCALARIRDSKSYKLVAGFDTFEAYCRDRWDMGKRFANYQIAAAIVVDNLGTMVPVFPTMERHVRPLTKLQPKQQREAWQRALDLAGERRVTAKLVSSVVDEFTLDGAVDGVAVKKQTGDDKKVNSNEDRIKKKQKHIWSMVEKKLNALRDYMEKNCRLDADISPQTAGSILDHLDFIKTYEDSFLNRRTLK